MTINKKTIDGGWLARPCPEVASELIGCTLVRRLADGQIIRGAIVETEAYQEGDPACHGSRRRTPSNEAMFGPPGTIYVYLIYGMYNCLNISSDRADFASGVLIRALQLETIPPGLEEKAKQGDRLAAGPGKLCLALQIDRSLNGEQLKVNETLWLEHRTPEFQQSLDNGENTIIQTTRIGISLGKDLPWRWYLANCPAVSRKGC